MPMPEERPRITVAICTYNRADALDGSVTSTFGQETGVAFEVMVVDNNSSDNTGDVVAALQARYPGLRYLVEEKLGLSHARNRALAEASSEIVAYIDDDCVTLPGWLDNLARAFDAPEVGCAGGRVHVGYPGNHRPEWLTPDMEGILGHYNCGPDLREVTEIRGGNFATRRDIALEVGGFSTVLGYQGTKKLAGEDVEFSLRVTAAGHKVIYVPNAEVIHNIDESRLDRRWLLERHRLNGCFRAIVHRRDLSVWRISHEYVRVWILSLLYRLRGDPYQHSAWTMSCALQAGMLDELLPGTIGGIQRLALAVGAFPAVIWRAAQQAIIGTKRLPRR